MEEKTENLKEHEENIKDFGENQTTKETGHGKVDISVPATESSGEDFSPLDEGTYEVEYAGALKKTKDGDDYLSHKWIVIGLDPERWLFENSSLVLSEKSKLWDIAKVCGCLPELGKEFHLNEMIGKKCQVYVIVHEYTKDGNIRKTNRIKSHVPNSKKN